MCHKFLLCIDIYINNIRSDIPRVQQRSGDELVGSFLGETVRIEFFAKYHVIQINMAPRYQKSLGIVSKHHSLVDDNEWTQRSSVDPV